MPWGAKSITITGRQQSIALAKSIKSELAGLNKIKVFHSPSNRVRETAYFVLSHIPNLNFNMHEMECIRNLNWGKTTPENARVISRKRYKAGVLYYQFPCGDYTPVFVRKIGDFVKETILTEKDTSECVIIFTHGFALRVIIKHIIGISDEDFRFLRNPPNCYLSKINLVGDMFILDKPLLTISL